MEPVSIVSVGTAQPEHAWRQEELRRMYHEVATAELRPAAVRLMDRVFREEAGIERRALACADPRTLPRESPADAQRRYEQAAPALAARALQEALAEAAWPAHRVAALICCTCTGYLCPGISSYLVERLSMPAATRCYDLVGMGCGASLPGLDLARQLAPEVAPAGVAVVAVEICSATAVFGEEPDLIVSNALFADGAAAALVSAEARGPVRLLAYASEIRPLYRDRLRLVHDGTRLRNRLDRSVPELAAAAADAVVARLLAGADRTPAQIEHWLVHPGGTRILEAVQATFGLTASRLRYSYDVLRWCGNMSSPTSLFVLKRFLESEPAPGLGVLLAFGAGFSCYASLFRVP